MTRIITGINSYSHVFYYRLLGDKGLGGILIAPGWSIDDATRDLMTRYGKRFDGVEVHRPRPIEIINRGEGRKSRALID